MENFITTAFTAKQARGMNWTKRLFGQITEKQYQKNKEKIRKEFAK